MPPTQLTEAQRVAREWDAAHQCDEPPSPLNRLPRGARLGTRRGRSRPMTRHYTRLIAVTILIAAFSASWSAEHDTRAEPRTKAAQRDAEAQFNLWALYATGRGVPRDDAEAVRGTSWRIRSCRVY